MDKDFAKMYYHWDNLGKKTSPKSHTEPKEYNLSILVGKYWNLTNLKFKTIDLEINLLKSILPELQKHNVVIPIEYRRYIK